MNRCLTCTATWSGQSRCHCSGCHNTFGGVTSFDRHRRSFECRQPEELGLSLNASGVWVEPSDGVDFASFGGAA